MSPGLLDPAHAPPSMTLSRPWVASRVGPMEGTDIFVYKTLVDAPTPSERHILHLGTLGPRAGYLPRTRGWGRRGGHQVSLCQIRPREAPPAHAEGAGGARWALGSIHSRSPSPWHDAQHRVGSQSTFADVQTVSTHIPRPRPKPAFRESSLGTSPLPFQEEERRAFYGQVPSRGPWP